MKNFLPRSALHRLPVKDLYRTSGSGMNLIIHHMLETLVIGRSQEYLGIQLATSLTIVENLENTNQNPAKNEASSAIEQGILSTQKTLFSSQETALLQEISEHNNSFLSTCNSL